MKEKMGHLAVRAEFFILIILCVRWGVKYAGQMQRGMITGRNQSREQLQDEKQLQSKEQLQGEKQLHSADQLQSEDQLQMKGQIWTRKQTQTDGKIKSVEEVQAADEQNGKTTQSDESGKVYGNMQSDETITNQDIRPKVALTFDDGPNSKYTPVLLEGLKERGVHATFFLMGKNIEGKEDLVKQIQADGHLIGNHTYDHVELDKISKENAKEEINTTNQEIYEITGIYPEWIRPPYGAWRKNLDFYVTMFPVLWDIDTLDWKSKNVESVLQIVKSQVEDGSIILMHDAYQSSVDAALQIVDILQEEGYEFVTVDELILP